MGEKGRRREKSKEWSYMFAYNTEIMSEKLCSSST